MAKKIILIIIAVLIIALGAAAYLNRSTIKTVFEALKYSGEDLEGLRENNEKTLHETTEKLVDAPIFELSEEQKDALKSGELSEDEAVKIILGNTQESNPQAPAEAENPATEQKPVENKPEQQKPVENKPEKTAADIQSEKQQKIAELVAKLYVMKDTFIGKLEGLLAEAKAEFSALPEGERSTSKLIDLASKYMSTVSSLEDECDGKVIAITDELRTLLEETGGDPSLADVILTNYADEKAIKKAYYIDLYKSKLG